MNKKISRRSFLKRIGKVSFVTAITGLIGHHYIKHWEPFWIDMTELKLTHPLIPPVFNNFKIVQFSDTHLGFQMDEDKLKKTIQIISLQNPDMIIFSGDLIDNLLTFFEYDQVIALLSTLTSTYGKFAVYGNHDHGGWGTEKYREIMEASGYKILQNDASILKISEHSKIAIAGIDDAMLGKPDFIKTFKAIPKNTFTLLISHAPDLAEEAKNFPVHFQISGHTHGGQVQLPFVGPLITPPFGEKYTNGLYTISPTFSLYVNRGLGTTRLPYRFLSRPEITLFTLFNKNLEEE
jgi:uncharacterized protein